MVSEGVGCVFKVDKQTKGKIIDSLEKKKRYLVSSAGGTVEAKNLEEAEEKVMELINIQEINEDGENIDG